MDDFYVRIDDGHNKSIKLERVNPFRELFLISKNEAGEVYDVDIISARAYPIDSLVLYNANTSKENALIISRDEAGAIIAEHLQKENSEVQSVFKTQRGPQILYVWYHPLESETETLRFILDKLFESNTGIQCGEWSCEGDTLYYHSKETGISIHTIEGEMVLIENPNCPYSEWFSENYLGFLESYLYSGLTKLQKE